MKHKDESAFEYMSRIVNNCNYEPCSLLDDLPTIASVVDFFEIWSKYDTDLLEGVEDAIEDGEDPKYYNDFVKKHNLPWCIYKNGKWVDRVKRAV